MRIPDEEEGGTANRIVFEKEVDDAWDEVHGNGNGIIDFDQFKAFMNKMNDCAVARGLKSRDYTEEEWDMIWTAFNGYNGGNSELQYEGITKDDLMYVSRLATYGDVIPSHSPSKTNAPASHKQKHTRREGAMTQFQATRIYPGSSIVAHQLI